MKISFSIPAIIVTAISLAISPALQAKDPGNNRSGDHRSGDSRGDNRGGNRGDYRGRDGDHRGSYGGNRYRSGYGYYRPGINFYPRFGYGYGYGGYYGRPYSSVSIGLGSSYVTDYSNDDDRPIYRGRMVRESGNNSLEVSVQKKLARLGYYAGEYDGDIGPASRKAILKYQRDNDLPTTGEIDRKLVSSLDLS